MVMVKSILSRAALAWSYASRDALSVPGGASFETKASDVPPTAYDEGGRGVGSLPNPRGVARA